MLIIVNLILIVVVIGVAMMLIRRTQDTLTKDSENKIAMLRTEFSNALSRNTELILQQLNSINTNVGSQLANTARVFGEVKESLGALDQKTQQIYEVGKDISSLQEILKAPKMRGGFGELLLENLLREILPREFYELQYSFRSGDRVDAVIKIGKKIVCVDSKFPMESFNRLIKAESEEDKKRIRKEFIKAVKDHINNIADKYIAPDENTYDFALMYVPAENVYYETIIKGDEQDGEKAIFTHAISKKVIPVSPNSFYAYLQVIIFGLRGLGIQEKTQEVIKKLIALKSALDRFREDFSKIGTHIKNINSSYGEAKERLDKFGDKLSTIESLDTSIETKEIEGQ